MEKHIRCKPGDVAKFVLLPGDPARADRIAAHFDEANLVARNREYTVYTGTYRGVDVSVCSTGIGGPSAAIAMEELARVGADTFIRVGSAGARQKHIPIGSTVAITAAIRGEGTSRSYLPIEFPAVADLRVTNAIIHAMKRLYGSAYYGIAYTRDAFYVQNPELNRQFLEAGVVASEMECATLFIVAAARGLACGAVVGTDSNIFLEQQPTLEEKEALYMVAEQRAIKVALEAIYMLATEKEDTGNL